MIFAFIWAKSILINKKIVAIIIHLLKYTSTGIISATVVYLSMAMLLSFLPARQEPLKCDPDREIYLTSNGVHLDIVLPAENIDEQFLSQLDVSSATQFVSFGWGDKNFYLKTPEWSDLTFSVAFKALFLKSESAMHVTRYQRKYSHWKRLELCPHQLDSLNSFIENSFKKTETGRIQKMSCHGYSNNDSFYEAKGYFTLFKTCNVWTNNALKEIEVKTSVWSPFDFGVLYHLPD